MFPDVCGAEVQLNLNSLIYTVDVYPETFIQTCGRIGGFLAILGALSVLLRFYNSRMLEYDGMGPPEIEELENLRNMYDERNSAINMQGIRTGVRVMGPT